MLPYYKPPAPDPEPEPEDDPDPEGVNMWRYECLIEAGWDDLMAGLLAVDPEIDLHRACDLLRGGCDQATAWEILS